MDRRKKDAGASIVPRRSRRMALSERIRVHGNRADGTPFEQQTDTVSVSAHGALILLDVPVKSGQALNLVHKTTQEEMEAQVVYIGEKLGAKIQVAVQFSKPSPFFWQVVFPPDDWLSA